MTATTDYIDLNDPARKAARLAATRSRLAVATAQSLLTAAGYEKIRVDQHLHPETRKMVETGYVYGEARLTVHVPRQDYVSPEVFEFRLTGHGSHADRFREFRALADC
jgi:hypothetical protein